jgi:hypothetical protein
MQTSFQEIQQSSLAGSSPSSVTWFFDRIPNTHIVDQLINNNTLWDISSYQVQELFQVTYPIREIIDNNNNYNNYINNYIINYTINNNNFNNILERRGPFIHFILDNTIEITEEQQDCCLCFEKKDKTEICRLNCSHTFCGTCINNTIESYTSRNVTCCCPLCRDNIETVLVQTDEIYDKLLQYS